jgi:hypothetical protein
MLNPVRKKNRDAVPSYIQMALGKTRLLFPGTEVLSLEAIPAIGTPHASGSIGCVDLNRASLAVYNFDEQLHPRGEIPEGRHACVCLGDGDRAFALLCDKVEMVEGAELQIVELPACMRSATTPVQFLALQGTRILCVSCVKQFAGVFDLSRNNEAGS